MSAFVVVLGKVIKKGISALTQLTFLPHEILPESGKKGREKQYT